MDIVACRDLPYAPLDIAVLPSNTVIVLSRAPQGMVLDAYDADFALMWHRELGNDALDMAVDARGTPWVLDRSGAMALTDGGDTRLRVPFAPPDGMTISGFAITGADLIVACQHAAAGVPREPILARVGEDASIKWLVSPHDDRIDLTPPHGRTAVQGGPWSPSDWVNSYYRPGAVIVSGGLIYVSYIDMPRSGYGLGYVLDPMDGSLRFVVGTTVADEASPWSDGLLIGCARHTRLYDRHGRVKTEWETAGIHVIGPRDTRVLEMDHGLPSRSRVARLLPDGSVERGDLIDGYATSRPYMHEDGTVVFVRRGMLTAVRDLAIVERVFVYRAHTANVEPTRVVPVADGLVTTYAWYRRRRLRQAGLIRFTL